jgi:protease-4
VRNRYPSVIGISIALALQVFAAAVPARTADITAPLSPPLRSELEANRFVADADDASAIYVNPAGLAWKRFATSLLQGTYLYDRVAEANAAAGWSGAGLGYTRIDDGSFISNTYVAGVAAKLSRTASLGASFKWHHTDLPFANRSPFAIDLGLTIRPSRSLSIAGVWKNANEPAFSAGEAVDPFRGSVNALRSSFIGGLSLRPLGELLTLSAQAETWDGRKPGWLFGGRMRALAGVEIFGSYRRDLAWAGSDPYDEYTAGFAVSLGSARLRAQGRAAADGDLEHGRWSLAYESARAHVRESIARPKRCAEIAIEGSYLDEGGGFSLMGGSKDLHAVLRELESIRSDEDVNGLLLTIGPLRGGFIGPVSGNLWEIRRAVLAVREAGKPVVAYLGEGGSSEEFYLASAADRIVAPRTSSVGLIGVSFELNRMKRLFGKLGVDFDHDTAGEYKSTFHALYTDTATADQAEEIRSLVDESYRLLVEGIAEGRNIPVEKMSGLADGRIFRPEELVAEGLIDAVGWERDAKTELGGLVSARRPDRLETSPVGRRIYWTERWRPAPAVAIVGAYGGIASGKSGRSLSNGSRTMGSATVVRQLKAAAKHPGVRAIVLRVDSGGGSALASDEILEEIRRIQREDKLPVVVSMGDVAGSGGYWISMCADRIFADPFTITGSIGVVWFKPVLERLYEKIGVTNETYKRGEHADALSWSRRMTAEELGMLDAHIEGMYDLFVDNVAAGRGLTSDRVREIGGGRVYLGTQALELRLIDELGGLSEAVTDAARRGGIERDYRTVYFKAFPGLFGSFEFDGGPVGIARALGRLLAGRGETAFDETLIVF